MEILDPGPWGSLQNLVPDSAIQKSLQPFPQNLLLIPLLDIRFRTVNYNGGDDSHSTSRS